MGSRVERLDSRGHWLDGLPFRSLLHFSRARTERTWQQIPIERELCTESIGASGGRFVAVGSEHDALVSDDGMTWNSCHTIPEGTGYTSSPET